MFTWICPKCGREVPPAYSECPDCAAQNAPPRAARPAAPPPQPQQAPPPGYPPPQPYAAPPPSGYPPPQQPYAAPPPPGYPPQPPYPAPPPGYPPPQPPYAAPPPSGYPPQQPYAAPPPGYPPQQPYAAPPSGYPPPQSYAPPEQPYGAPPQQPEYAPSPQPESAPPEQPYAAQPAPEPPAAQWTAAPPPAPRAGPALPIWLLVPVFALAILGVVFGVYWLVGGHGSGSATTPSTTVESPAAKPGASTNPLQKFIEVAGVRFEEDPKNKDKVIVKFVLINHSDDDLANLAGNVTIWARTPKSEEDAQGTFSFATPMKPDEVKELTAPFTTKQKVYALPDWQFLTADLQITAPGGSSPGSPAPQ